LVARRRQHEQARQEADRVRGQLQAHETDIAQLEGRLQEDEQALESLQDQHRRLAELATQVQVQMATSDQSAQALRRQWEQVALQCQERQQGVQEIGRQMAQATDQLAACQRQALEAGSQWALLALQYHQLRQWSVEQQATDQRLQAQRTAITQQVHDMRAEQHQQEMHCHQCELAIERLQSERDNLAQRVREDYGLELAELDARLADQPRQERAEVDEEIAQLRRRIANIGAVNMEALGELDELEQRFGGMHAQYQDLVQAKESLERIIERINRDSRRLFSETLETIRQNFQLLFRRVFGGGTADIVLEEGVDILEAGVEIIATPPGKHSLSISLLSGGEKALTAVTLLLAIFQFRPSPFCVLDEVDGPLDEANIGRFLEVLREFLQWTRFVVVTHSKKTMTAATTLYGVTMQESGVSKRVSVQFDDVSEDGQIRREALARSAGEDPQPEVA
jgi:chromosome segregation protein